MVTMSQPFFSSRKWIKVWINEWREGTLRWQATDFQRAFWIDLLALAGRSRYPGIVCAGKDADKVVGYPTSFLAPNSGITEENIKETLDLFKSKGMVTYSTSLSYHGATLYAVTITNWKKYQSDYEANKTYQKTYRARKKASSSSTERLTSQLVERKSLEGDLEVEKEGEEDKEAEATTSAFAAISCKPFGGPKFKEFWTNEYLNHDGGSWADAMERVAEKCQANRVKVPGRFFAHKREIEKLEAEQTYKRHPL
jgi:hypothetical protein